jgi:plasmid stabilization system protein ParE
MADIILLRRAAFDIDEIIQDSTKRWGEKVADDYIASIDNALQLLAEHTHLLRAFEGSEVLYYYPVRKHSLFCTICDNTIYVLTVKYGGMNLERVIHDLEPMLLSEIEIMHHKLQATDESTKK